MVGNIILPEIRSLIAARDFNGLREIFKEWPPADVADVILDLEENEQVILFRVLPTALAADVFEYIGIEEQQKLLRAMAHEQVVGILNEMSPDDRTALLEELPSAAARQLIRLLTPEERRVAQVLLGYAEGSVGRLMTPDFIAIHEDWTVKEVLDYVREYGQDSETLNVLYVVDEQGKLIDDVRIREFLLKPLTAKISEIRDETFIALRVNDSQEDAVNIFRKYDRSALPVVDSNNVLVGIVTIDDMLDVAEEQATEDIQKIGGMEALDEPYMRISFFEMVRKRAVWLVVLFLGEMLTATAMATYQDELARAPGAGPVSSADYFERRKLGLPSVDADDPGDGTGRSSPARLVAGDGPRISSRIALGGILGVIGIIRVGAWAMIGENYFHHQPYGPHWPLIALTVGISLVGVVLWGTLSGSMLPFVLRRFGADPATSSAPFVATLVDVTGLIIYFSIAFVILRGAML